MIVPFFQYLLGLVAWSAISLGIGYAWFPLFTKFINPRLAWPLCRLLAVPFTTLIVLWPSVIARIPIGPTPSFVGLALIAFASRWFSGMNTAEIHVRLRDVRPVRFEIGVIAAAASFLTVILFITSMTQIGERLHDGAVWATLPMQGTYPFFHPWLAGVTIPYYFLGYLTVFQVFQFIPLPPLMSYNLALAVVPVAYLLALWCFFFSLGEKPRMAAVGTAVVALSSNLKSARQVVDAVLSSLPFSYWDSSRVVAGTINEFPLWTTTFGDLHPHLMSLWLVPTALTLGLSALRERLVTPAISVRAALAVLGAGMLALTVGMHTWDAPLIIFFFGASFLLTKPSFSLKREGKWIGLGAAMAVFLAAPYLKHMAGAPKTFGWVEQRSQIFEFLGVWGLWYLPLICLAGWRLYRRKENDLLAVLALALPLSLVFQSTILLVLSMMALLITAFRRPHALSESDRILQGLALIALTLCLGCELIYLKDAFSGENHRLNTVFKIYMPAWTLLGCSVVLALRTLREEVPSKWFRPGAAVWLAAAAAYLIGGVPSRIGLPRLPSSLDGYGDLQKISAEEEQVIRWMNQESGTPGFFGTVLTGIDGAYRWPGFVASFTGLPLYAAWEGYSFWLHFPALNLEHGRRTAIVRKIFDGSYFLPGDSCERLRERLREEKIDYVFIGTYERKKGNPAALQRLEGCLPPLVAVGPVKLLGTRPQTL